MISKQTIDEILLASKIEDVVGDFVALKKRGQNWVGLCPFHDDKNPSMYVSPRLGIFKCFVCDSGGNAVHFLMEHEKISYPEALRYLAKKYNIHIEEEEAKTDEELAQQSENESLFALNNYAEKYFIDNYSILKMVAILLFPISKSEGLKKAPSNVLNWDIILTDGIISLKMPLKTAIK